MKYAIYLFAVLALMGAGCTETTIPTLTEEPETDSTMEESMEEMKDETMEEETEDATNETDKETSADEGVTINVDAEGNVEVITEDDSEETEEVETTDIVLGGAPDQTIVMTTGNFFFNPSTITASPGQRILIDFTSNTGTHDFVIDELNVDYDIEEGGNYIFTVPDEPGTYSYYCSIGSHRAMGMEGTLIIE